MWPRVILHADMDAFFAAVEQLDNPALRGKPVLIGTLDKRSVVSTASYEARPFGVGSAMPMTRALRLCPRAIVVPPRFDRYAEISARIMEVFGHFSPLVEALSLDEAFLDMTGTERLFGSPTSMGRAIKQAVYEATGGLTVSVGASTTKFVAKVASDHHKPDGLTVVPPDDVRSFLWPQRSSKLWGVGPRATSILTNAGLTTIADVAYAPRELLTALLGALGAHVHALAHGDDPRLVEPTGAPKSIGHEETFANDILCRDEALPVLLRAADSVAERLRRRRLVAGGARLKLKTAAFALLTRQHKLAQATSSAGPLYQCALALLMEFPWNEPIRLVGLTAYDLCDATAPAQQELFEPKGARGLQKLDATLDTVRARFGHTAIRRASELPSAKPPRSGG